MLLCGSQIEANGDGRVASLDCCTGRGLPLKVKIPGTISCTAGFLAQAAQTTTAFRLALKAAKFWLRGLDSNEQPVDNQSLQGSFSQVLKQPSFRPESRFIEHIRRLCGSLLFVWVCVGLNRIDGTISVQFGTPTAYRDWGNPWGKSVKERISASGAASLT